MLSNNDIMVALAKGVRIFYDAMISKLNDGTYPKGDPSREPPTTSIQEATSVTPPKATMGGVSMSVVIDLNKAPYAAAYEWGKSEPYTITPKPGTAALVFPRERWPQYEPPPPAPARFRFMEVTHKQIVAKPYIKPTLEQTKEAVARTIGREVIASIKSKFHSEIVK